MLLIFGEVHSAGLTVVAFQVGMEVDVVLDTFAVVIDHFTEGVEPTVVHIRAGERYVAEEGYFDNAVLPRVAAKFADAFVGVDFVEPVAGNIDPGLAHFVTVAGRTAVAKEFGTEQLGFCERLRA